MLSRIDLDLFKCFKSIKIPLRPLTLLSGANASGKSSVIQALALLNQTMREHEWSSRLMLNGASVRLGTASDVIDQVYGEHSFAILLEENEEDWLKWEFESEPGEMSMLVRSVRAGNDNQEPRESSPTDFRLLIPLDLDSMETQIFAERLQGLTYLTAERLGPREYYESEDLQTTPVVGAKGEHAVSILHSTRRKRVLAELVDSSQPPTCFNQVQAWMAQFFPGCELEVEHVPYANVVTLRIRTSSEGNFSLPSNTGFGITQVLPIVVAALSAEKDGLLLIENPEVHLHPAGQAKMGQFLAKVASAGVQVIAESHSDHVLNGIRRAVKAGDLSQDQVALHYFRPRSPEGTKGPPQVESPAIDAHGNIDSWPDGFFDQFDKDMNHFAGWD